MIAGSDLLVASRLQLGRAMRWACQIVPSLALGLCFSGCYAMHGACDPPRGDVCCDDVTGAVVAPLPDTCPGVCPRGSTLRSHLECVVVGEPDAGIPHPPPLDAGPGPLPDAGLRCPPVRASATCLESFLVQPGRPFELPVAFDTCGCCPMTECAVEVTSVDGAPTLRLTTTMCADPCDCAACTMPEARCAVPALSEGAWNVVVNDEPAFLLPVFADSGLVPPPPACVTYAEPDACTEAQAQPDAWGWRPSRVCVREGEWHGGPASTVVTLTHSCWGCGDLHGACVASVEPRFTDDLPPGGEIRLAPTAFATACDVDCPAVCEEREVRCVVPPLVPGDYYRVWADGEIVLSFVAGEAGRVCSE